MTFKGDPDFDKLLLDLHLVNSNTIIRDKIILFYFVCIVIRFILYYLVYLLRNNKYINYIIFIISLFATINLFNGINKTNEQWWSKKFQLLISLILLITSILLIFNLINNTNIIPCVLFISLFGGIVQSLLRFKK